MARTAVIAGTATAVSGGVHNRQAQKAEAQQATAAQQQQAMVDQAATQAAAQVAAQQAVPAAPAPPAGGDDPIAKLKELAELKAQGLLSDDEFAAAKAKLLGL
ncbi:SHOCT domain-containing protein [Rhabdothermincola salaria]|uniref:SHOCT domain-containing protein n=1 Tax=Rhabdothermincola salaria TaxID=2903142 RepID=UPI001E46582A|nr:SHOCT domain-containing protein [Rhabdothermincola salaria]MCD9622912.1 SHOCT domain-containing protein [Rhabdothermincola salaria]